jgi:hypothetical protein
MVNTLINVIAMPDTSHNVSDEADFNKDDIKSSSSLVCNLETKMNEFKL